MGNNEYPSPSSWQAPEHPRQVESIPFASPWAPRFYWPVKTLSNKGREVAYVGESGTTHGAWGRRFLASRETDSGVKRYHCGVDLWGEEGDMIVAICEGVIINAASFYHGTDRILVAHDSCVVNYGEVKPKSWEEFDLNPGSKVSAGAPIARVGKMHQDSMCHFETYVSGTTATSRYYKNSSKPPDSLLNPTALLLAIAANGR